MLSILGPQFLGALRTVVSTPPDWRNWRQVSSSIILILISPIHIYVEYMKLSYLEMKLKLTPNDESLILAKEQMKRNLNMHVKLELGLETIYQMAGQLILLFMAYTETPTQSGLKSIFHKGRGTWPIILLVSSIILSFYSCIASHWKALTACREYFPFKSRFISGLYCLFGCLTRVTAIIMFFAGPLGLFNLLQHLQGEKIPFHANVLQLVNPNDGMMILGGKAFKWNSVDRWKNVYKQHKNGTFVFDATYLGPTTFPQPIKNPSHEVIAPDCILYTGLSLGLYLLIFFATIGIHLTVIYVAKAVLCKSLWKKLNFLERIIHSLENTNIAYNIKEWDDGEGDAKEHKRRMQSNWYEVLQVIIINGIFNLLHLVPLCYLSK